MFGLQQIAGILANGDLRNLAEMVKKLSADTPEHLEERRKYAGNIDGDSMRILALVIVLVIRDWKKCLLAVLEVVKADHLEIPVLFALDRIRKKVF